MVSVRINGEDTPLPPAAATRFADLVEVIKTKIDPEHMIATILIDGRELSESDWASTLSDDQTLIIEFETDTPGNFVKRHLASAGSIVGSMYLEFRDARKSFQRGDMVQGNQGLMRAVNTAKAFFEWYSAMLQLVPAAEKSKYDITVQVEEITGICKRICQQQLYQSWWALGETLEKELEPKLDKLEDICQQFSTPSV